MTFDADAAAAAATDEYEPFHFTWQGQEHELPHPMTLTEAQAVQLRGGQLHDLLAEIAPEAHEVIMGMQLHVSSKLAEAWFELAGDEGKEPSPPSPPNRAGRRSKQTSRSVASNSVGSGSTK